MCADIYTKAFTESGKWIHACELINIVSPKELIRVIIEFCLLGETPASRPATPDQPGWTGSTGHGTSVQPSSRSGGAISPTPTSKPPAILAVATDRRPPLGDDWYYRSSTTRLPPSYPVGIQQLDRKHADLLYETAILTLNLKTKSQGSCCDTFVHDKIIPLGLHNVEGIPKIMTQIPGADTFTNAILMTIGEMKTSKQ